MAYESETSFLDQMRVRHLLARLQGQCHDNAQVCEAAYQAVWLCFRCSSRSVKRMLIAGVVADIRERRKGGLRRIRYMVSMLETEQLVEVYVLMKYWLHDEMLPDLLLALQALLATPKASSLLLSAVADVARLQGHSISRLAVNFCMTCGCTCAAFALPRNVIRKHDAKPVLYLPGEL